MCSGNLLSGDGGSGIHIYKDPKTLGPGTGSPAELAASVLQKDIDSKQGQIDAYASAVAAYNVAMTAHDVAMAAHTAAALTVPPTDPPPLPAAPPDPPTQEVVDELVARRDAMLLKLRDAGHAPNLTPTSLSEKEVLISLIIATRTLQEYTPSSFVQPVSGDRPPLPPIDPGTEEPILWSIMIAAALTHLDHLEAFQKDKTTQQVRIDGSDPTKTSTPNTVKRKIALHAGDGDDMPVEMGWRKDDFKNRGAAGWLPQEQAHRLELEQYDNNTLARMAKEEGSAQVTIDRIMAAAAAAADTAAAANDQAAMTAVETETRATLIQMIIEKRYQEGKHSQAEGMGGMGAV